MSFRFYGNFEGVVGKEMNRNCVLKALKLNKFLLPRSGIRSRSAILAVDRAALNSGTSSRRRLREGG